MIQQYMEGESTLKLAQRRGLLAIPPAFGFVLLLLLLLLLLR